MTPQEAVDGYPDIHQLLMRIERYDERSRHLVLCRLAGFDPHLVKRCLDIHDRYRAVEEALLQGDRPL